MRKNKSLGRPRKPARTERGRKILAELDKQGLSLTQAARKAGITFNALYRAIHGNPSKLSSGTVEALCAKLSLPLSLVSPKLSSVDD